MPTSARTAARTRSPAVTHKRPLQPDHNSRAPRRKPDRREHRLFDDRSLLRARHVCRTQRQLSGTLTLYETTSASSGAKGAGVGRARHPVGKDQAPIAARAPRPPNRSPSAVVSPLPLSAGRSGMVASSLGPSHGSLGTDHAVRSASLNAPNAVMVEPTVEVERVAGEKSLKCRLIGNPLPSPSRPHGCAAAWRSRAPARTSSTSRSMVTPCASIGRFAAALLRAVG